MTSIKKRLLSILKYLVVYSLLGLLLSKVLLAFGVSISGVTGFGMFVLFDGMLYVIRENMK